MEEKEKWFTLKQASKEMKVTTQFLNNCIRKGTLQASQISDSSRYGFHYMVSESALIEWAENRTSRKTAPKEIKELSDYSDGEIIEEMARRIIKAYEDGVKVGRKQAKKEMLEAMKGV